MDRAESPKKRVAFKISSRTARMLGRQNVSNQYVAIIELIKNAYDADAPGVKVSFVQAGTPLGVIIIEDNGSGMDEEALLTRWLMIGTDFKEREPISQGGRVRAGAKGIGRFALDRLGSVGTLETFQSPNSNGLRLTIDWSKYDTPGTDLESITHELESIPNPERRQGTKIIITKLRDKWTESDYHSLYDDLVFLIPPLENYVTDFSIDLQIDENNDLSGFVKPLVRAAAEYELNSSLSLDGRICHVLRHHSGEEVRNELNWQELDSQLGLFDLEPSCGPLKATILFYLRDSGEAKKFDYKITDLRRYLDTFRGIRLYRDGFQIKPYGSKGNDWLDLDSRKQRSPEGVGQDLGRYRVSNNQLIGAVVVSRSDNFNLEDKTSREGLIENLAYFDLKKFLMSGITFLERERQLRVRRAEIEDTDEPLRETVEAVVAVVEKIQSTKVLTEEISLPNTALVPEKELSAQTPNSFTPTVLSPPQLPQKKTKLIVEERDIKDLVQFTGGLKSSMEAKLQELQLLRALATIGIALATFAHEIKENIISVLDETILLHDSIEELPLEVQEEALERLRTAITSAQRVENWGNFVLERVKKSRRTEQNINFAELVNTVLRPFTNSFSYRSVLTDIQIDDAIPTFTAFPIDFEAIIINLVTNAVKALEKVPLAERQIRMQATYLHASQQLEIDFEDSGLGIKLKDLPNAQKGVQQVLEPFISGKDTDGTGMGLAVINRIVNDHRGTITVNGQGNLGGAHFHLTIPIKLAGDLT